VRRRRKCHRTSTAPPTVLADAPPNRVWAADFQFDVTTDGRPIKIVSIIDETPANAKVAWSIAASPVSTSPASRTAWAGARHSPDGAAW
jgi:hypothetical protein